MKKINVFLCFVVLSVTISFGQNNFRIYTYNSDANEALQGVIVKLIPLNKIEVSDKNGVVVFNNIPIGFYQIQCSYIGYTTIVKEVEVKGGSSLNENNTFDLEVGLEKESISMPEVVVSSTRGIPNFTPITFSNVNSIKIEESTKSSDLSYAFQTLPSVTLHSENGNGLGYTYIRIRGFDQRRISVLINGVPQNDPEDHNVYWINFYDLAGVLQDAQIQRGAGAAFYGPPAIGGSVNLITKSFGNEPAFSSEVGYGSFNTQKLSFSAYTGRLWERLSLYTRVTRVTSSGYRDWSWSSFWKAFLAFSYNDENNSLKINFQGGPQKDALAFYGIPKNYNDDSELRKYNFGEVSKDVEYLHQPQLSVLYDYNFNDHINLHNTFFYISGDGYFDFDGSWGTNQYFRLDSVHNIPSDLMIRAYVDNDQFGWMPQLVWNYEKGKLITGFEFRSHRSLHWARIEKGSGLDSRLIGENASNFYEYKGGKDVASLYFNNMYQLSKNINLMTDVQFVYQKYKIFDEKYVGTDFNTPYTFVNPKLGINYSFNENYSIYLSAALTHREPPLKNLYEAESASWGVEPQFERNDDGTFNYNKPLVKPEDLLNFELGYRMNYNNLRVNITGYYMDFNNEIVPSGGLDIFGQPRVGNAAKTLHLGLEFESSLKLFSYFDLYTNFTLSRNRFIDFTEYDDDGKPQDRDDNFIANAPEFISNIGLSFNYKKFAAGLNFKHTGEQYTDNSQTSEKTRDENLTIDEFSVFDLRFSYQLEVFGISSVVSAEIINLMNKYYLMTGFGSDNFFPASTRSYFLSLKVSY